jgi:ribonuclease HI
MLRQSNLKGFNIPGVSEKLITTLFADDTTVYLSEFDNYADLQNILNVWCIASGARFNIGKTEILPIGSATYRNSVITTRQIHPSQPPLTDGIHIVGDKEPVRILGAWIGNKVDQSAIWSPVIDKIRDNLAQWNKSHPTLFGRHLIVQMVVGGMSQYLTTTQGMPKQVEQILEKTIRKFVWEEAKPPVNLDTLCLPIGQGGIKLMNLKSRNKAIEIMWLKSYLTLGPTRPIWTQVADILIGESVTRSSGAVSSGSQMNVYLQTWRAGLHTGSTLPKNIRTMLKAGKDFNLSFESLKLSDALKEKLPAWYHIGVNHQLSSKLNNTTASKCLREQHNFQTVRDLIQNVRRTRQNNMTREHLDRRNCACAYCREDRLAYSCQAPNKCYKMAERLLEQIQPKWHPNNHPHADGLTHTTNRRQTNINARKENGEILFNPSLTSNDDLSHNFRIFTDINSSCADPAYRKHQAIDLPEEKVVVYTDGSCLENGTEEAQSGSGIWYGPDHPDNTSLRIPGTNQSNQVAELTAILYVAQKTAPFAPLLVKSDSKYAIDGITLNLQQWEEHGWIGVANKELFKAIVSHLRQRGATTHFQWVQGHDGEMGNEGADELAGNGALKTTFDVIDLSVNGKFNLTGAQLSCMSQALTYQGIQKLKEITPRNSTVINLDITRHAVKDLSNKLPSDATIWHSIRNKDITRTIRVFLWKMLHKTQKCGDYWLNIPGFEHRANCTVCRVDESMSHILTECPIPGQKEIWDLTRRLWEKKHNVWPETRNLGAIVGSGLANFQDSEGHCKPGANRLYKILMSESAHLIWKLRCTRVVELGDDNETWPSKQEIHNRWVHAMNRRLTLDIAMTNKHYGDKALNKYIVLQTWSGVLKDEASLPEDWTRQTGVLVGIVPLERQWERNNLVDPP